MKQTLAGTIDPPPFVAAFGGACLQLSVIVGVWVNFSSADGCLLSPMNCLGNLAAADPWGRQALLTYESAFGPPGRRTRIMLGLQVVRGRCYVDIVGRAGHRQLCRDE